MPAIAAVTGALTTAATLIASAFLVAAPLLIGNALRAIVSEIEEPPSASPALASLLADPLSVHGEVNPTAKDTFTAGADAPKFKGTTDDNDLDTEDSTVSFGSVINQPTTANTTTSTPSSTTGTNDLSNTSTMINGPKTPSNS